MVRMFTRREGATRCSFIMSTTSSPPALMAAPLTVSWMASSTEVASAHSNDFMASRSLLLLFVEGCEHDGRRHWDLADAHADGVVDGVGDRAGRGHRRRLADAGGVGRAAAPVLLNHDRFDLGHLLRSGDLVLLEVGVH